MLAGIVSQGATPTGRARVGGWHWLDRGWGKAAQTHTDADGGAIQVVIRQIIDVCGAAPVLIEHDDGCDEA